MSDTPRTDAAISDATGDHIKGKFDDFEHYMAMCGTLADFARTLERELAELHQGEKELSVAYLRIRELLVECLKSLLSEYAALRADIK